MLKPDGAGGDDHIPGLHVQINAAAGAHPEEGIRADIMQLLHGDRGRGAANARGADGDLLPQEGAGVDGELPVAGDKVCIVKQGGYGLASARITGKDAVTAHIAGLAVNMKLLFQFLHKKRPPFMSFFIVYLLLPENATAPCPGRSCCR